ncbi:terminase TerL endonuclease subunit [Ligilactobacillus cholophilus]|uniref:terminase TerL endonuclease subunit n=1 Tax=Ligilactobacillus cholophilus TaxID=3050131 RepID=UPI0025B1D78A|nr:terminase TerL endonuclease subunit [Ligilactobacillus cholophilus]
MRKIDLSQKDADLLTEYYTELDNGCYDSIIEEYRDPATRYCFRVLNEEVLTCNSIKLQAFRHIQDLRRITEDDNFNYYYDLGETKKLYKFTTMLVDPSNSKPMQLMDWQLNILFQANCWKDNNTNERRYTRAIVSMARTNGKSMLATVQLLYDYIFNCAGLTNQELLLALPSASQVEKVWLYLISYFKALEIHDWFTGWEETDAVEAQSEKVIARNTNNRILKRPFLSRRFDGNHFSTCVLDEVADSENQAVISESIGKITSGMVQAKNPMVFTISTAYPSSNCDFYKQQKAMFRNMEQDYKRISEDVLCIVYQQDNQEEVLNDELWIKSNPLLELDSLRPRMLKQMHADLEDMRVKGKEYEFINKNMNLWLNQNVDTYLDLKTIESGVIPDRPIDIQGKKVYIGCDLSNFNDDTSIAFIYPYVDSLGNNKFYIEEHSWIPTARAQRRIDLKEQQDNIPYRHLEEKGFCTIATNRFGYINYDEVFEWLINYINDNDLDVDSITYDKWRSDKFIKLLESNTSFRLIPLQQTVVGLNDATKDFQQCITEGNIKFLDDDIIKVALSNAILYRREGLIKIDKNKETEKIDCADAIIDAFYRARLHFDDIEDIEKQSKHPFENMTNKQIKDIFNKDYTF